MNEKILKEIGEVLGKGMVTYFKINKNINIMNINNNINKMNRKQ